MKKENNGVRVGQVQSLDGGEESFLSGEGECRNDIALMGGKEMETRVH